MDYIAGLLADVDAPWPKQENPWPKQKTLWPKEALWLV